MNQDQQLQSLWKDHWPIVTLAVLVAVIFVTGFLGYWQSWERPFWDWLGLLIIPVLLGLGAFWFNNQARKSEQAIALDRVQEEALQRYLDRMQELILEKELRRSEKGNEIRHVARARTLTVLKSLDGNRKGQVVRFLYELGLIGNVLWEESGERQAIEDILDFQTVERGVIESIVELHTVDLSSTYLSRANLPGADLRGADLSHANLSSANLNGTDLSSANLYGACMETTQLRGANLSSANLTNTDLSYANLYGAKNLADYQLMSISSLAKAWLPDGRMMTKKEWGEFKKSLRPPRSDIT